MPRNDAEYVYYSQYGCRERHNQKHPYSPCCSCCCCRGPAGPMGPMGPVGPAGANGAAGATGATGAAGPVGATGPRGLTGATGATGSVGTILGSYDTLRALIAAHPTGSQGDAYLVGGALYIWNTTTGQWESVGNLQGPAGATGATGPQGEAAVISGYYDDYDEFVEAHTTGTVGEMYIVEGNLYIWDEEAQQWRLLGSLIGPTGPAGPTGAAGANGAAGADGADGVNGADGLVGQIDGVVATEAALPAAAEPGTIYYVEENGALYVWDAATMSWRQISLAQGPRGATGPQGPTGPAGADGLVGRIDGVAETVAGLPATGVAQGTIYYVEENDGLYVWDAENGWTELGMIQGPRGATGATGATGAAGDPATAFTILPFASQQAPYVGTNNGGEPVNAASLGYGYMEYSTGGTANVAVDIDPNDGSFNLTATNNHQVAFSLPYDVTLESIYITVGNWGEFPLPVTGTLVYPYVQVYAAEPGTNSFFPVADAFAIPAAGIDPAVAAAATMRAASKTGLNINLRAGMRIAVCGMMRITGDTEGRNYYLYFTGGLGMRVRAAG